MPATIHVAAGLFALLLAALMPATSSHAENAPAGYPARQVRVIVPYPAGGPTDVMARLVAQHLSEKLGQNFFVENLTGASGVVGTGTAANSAGDGHTILFTTNDFAVRSEEHTSELQSPCNLVCRLLLEKKKKKQNPNFPTQQTTNHHPP